MNTVQRDAYLMAKAAGWWGVVERGLKALHALMDKLLELVTKAKIARPGAIGAVPRPRSVHEGVKTVRFS